MTLHITGHSDLLATIEAQRRELSRLESACESAVVEIDRLRAELTVMKASCAQAGKDAVQFQDDRDALAAENDRLRESARQLAVVSARDKYLCGLLVDWSVRANGGEDHGVPPEHILRTLIRQLEVHQAALGALGGAVFDPAGVLR